jgi:sensor histidine kinase YesM
MPRPSKLYWIVQFIGWGLFCSLIGLTSYIQTGFDDKLVIRIAILYFLLIMLSNGMRYVLLRFNWINLKITPLIPRALALNILASAVLLGLNAAIIFVFFGEWRFNIAEFLINIVLYSLFFVLWSAIYFTFHLLRKSRKQEVKNLKLKADNNEIELKMLRDQLNPHFLFNSLNSIRALIELEPGTAKSAITTLSNLLRDSLQLSKRSSVRLEEELKLVSDFLKLEKIRYEERLTYSITCEVDQQVEVPPFILQTITENAIKHGVSKKNDGGTVEVNIYEQADKLILEVINSGGTFQTSDSRGIGIINTKRRLHILYDDQAGFTIKNGKDQRVYARIWINKSQLKQTI